MVFNTDAAEFGGAGLSEKSYKSEAMSMHGFDDSISLTLAPLSVMYLKLAPARKKAEKPSSAKAPAAKKAKAPAKRRTASKADK